MVVIETPSLDGCRFAEERRALRVERPLSESRDGRKDLELLTSDRPST
jgi:hypothetical protein